MNREELLKIAKPILFNTEMVKAILEGRKTVTRRVIKRDILNQFDCEADGTAIAYIDQATGDSYKPWEVCRFKKGDYLYVRETWNISNMCADGNKVTFIYRGDKSEEESARTITVSDDAFDKYDEMMYEWMPEWRPSIHMPKEAARIFLKVTDVKVERLKTMTIEDCEKEGVYCGHNGDIFAFMDLWNSTIKKADLDKYGWEANPWVCVIEFERVEV